MMGKESFLPVYGQDGTGKTSPLQSGELSQDELYAIIESILSSQSGATFFPLTPPPATGIKQMLPRYLETPALGAEVKAAPESSLLDTIYGIVGESGFFPSLGTGIVETLGTGAYGAPPTDRKGAPSYQDFITSTLPGITKSIADKEFSPSIVTGPMSLGLGWAGKELGSTVSRALGLDEPFSRRTPGLLEGLLGIEDPTLKGIVNTIEGLAPAFAPPGYGSILPGAKFINALAREENIIDPFTNLAFSLATLGIGPAVQKALGEVPLAGPIVNFATNFLKAPFRAGLQSLGGLLGLTKPELTPEEIEDLIMGARMSAWEQANTFDLGLADYTPSSPFDLGLADYTPGSDYTGYESPSPGFTEESASGGGVSPSEPGGYDYGGWDFGDGSTNGGTSTGW